MARERRFFFVRGTPSAGKTTLCYQLFNYLLRILPNDRVSYVKIWEQQETVKRSLVKSCMQGDLQDDPQCVDDASVPHWLLFDEAQTTYSDQHLWTTFLKDLPGQYRVVLFASYGSQEPQGAVDIIGAPIVIPPHLQMGLRPTENGPLSAYIPGLYFTWEEFAQLLEQRSSLQEELPVLDADISTWVFETSGGHIGAIDSILQSIQYVAKNLGRVKKIALAKFFGAYSGPAEAQGMVFLRGLREDWLRSPENAVPVKYIRELLGPGAKTYEAFEVPDAAREAHERGWVDFREECSPEPTIIVEFPSLFHRSRMSYLLHGSKALPPAVEAMDLNTFVKEVVGSFSSTALYNSLRHTAGSQTTPSIPETLLQNEVYRAIYKVTQGGSGLWISPESGTLQSSTTTGRIDFYLMGSKKWGIEILRDGDRLDEHVRRCGPGGAYNVWLTTGQITEYVILDFRTHSQPRKKIPNEPVFHIEFGDDFQTFTIKDTDCIQIHKGTLLA
ncbi:hypothetical protein FB451DRAFT_709485 [Mycena latifolia]|nr:hypothetical protein FB451DRAFT_709485 [Mycena latifolia]